MTKYRDTTPLALGPLLTALVCAVMLAGCATMVGPAGGKHEVTPGAGAQAGAGGSAAAVESKSAAKNDDEDDGEEGEPLDGKDLEGTVPWEEILGAAADRFDPNPDIFFEDAILTPERLSALPNGLRLHPDLAHLAVSRAISEPTAYQGGVFGKVGSAKFFVTTRDRIADFDYLYRVMVQVLSEKFSCFMVSRQAVGESVRVTCRDKRRVVFWRAVGRNWIQFYARQFDREGYEIKVEKRKIVRLSTERVLF